MLTELLILSNQIKSEKNKFRFLISSESIAYNPPDTNHIHGQGSVARNISHSSKLKHERIYYGALKSSLNHWESQENRLRLLAPKATPKIRKLSPSKQDDCWSQEVITVWWPSWTWSWLHTKPDVLSCSTAERAPCNLLLDTHKILPMLLQKMQILPPPNLKQKQKQRKCDFCLISAFWNLHQCYTLPGFKSHPEPRWQGSLGNAVFGSLATTTLEEGMLEGSWSGHWVRSTKSLTNPQYWVLVLSSNKQPIQM